jgi:hypothetical protein
MSLTDLTLEQTEKLYEELMQQYRAEQQRLNKEMAGQQQEQQQPSPMQSPEVEKKKRSVIRRFSASFHK